MVEALEQLRGRDEAKLLFVCLGNICRSPAAEAIASAYVRQAHLDDRVRIDSAGLHSYHEGGPADERMISAAHTRGYDVTSISRPVTMDDYDEFDLIIGMDDANIQELFNRAPSLETSRKIIKMRDFGTQYPEYDHVPDPYYGGSRGFDLVLNLLEDSMADLISQLGEVLNS